MASAILDGTNIDTSVFSYSAPKANPAGGKVVNLYNKHAKESLTFSTPLILTWGAQEGKDQQGNLTGKWTMSLQFPNSEYPNADCEAFLAEIKKVETKIKEDAMVYSKDWFGKDIKSMEVMEEKFNVMLRYPKLEKGKDALDYNKPPTLTAKLPCWKGIWQPEIYDEEGTAMYVKGKTASHVTPLEFLKPKAADVERLKSLPPPEDDIDPDGAVVSTIVEDSDDEEERELPKPLPVPVAEPVAVAVEEPKKKKVVTKKKVEA